MINWTVCMNCWGSGEVVVSSMFGSIAIRCPECNGTGRTGPFRLPFTYWLEKNESQ
jgi:DnaJ-class molecular chaperone